MVLQIDTSEPLLRPSQLSALVCAVRDADPHDEHRWIEWKSSLDLTTPAGQGHIVKHVLGLANRDPTGASRWAGGYGYLLVGVEPGAVNGVTSVDPEVLVGQVRAFVGSTVQWTPELVSVDGAQVLVVIVDPPRPGDPIHCLRKQLDKFPPGTIFVRHTGRTDPHTPGDLEMLQARLLERTPSLQLTVAPVSQTIETTPDIIGAADKWVKQRRPELLAARHQPTSHPPTLGDIRFPVRSALNAFPPKVRPDTRTEEQYADQVEKFLTKAKGTLVDRGIWDLYRHSAALLQMRVSNPTDLGYTAVRLVVHIPGRVKGYSDAMVEVAQDDRPNFPRPPKPLGTPTVTDNELLARLASGYGSLVPPVSFPDLGRSLGPGPGYTVRDSGSVDIEYREFELRPGEIMTLDSVPLLVREDPGVTLTATWHATAAGVRGRLTGEFDLVIAESTFDLANLNRDDEADQ
ncbi:hypothetical protein HC031_25360 [Planosporangium thailandense]|uniref:Schlafen AlbA-2 domain-containing protein n=1 Tax=Planosporangium thailandense TaxID=765197 RepID=A0ABX0Y3Q7_9ACTN|nr:RNA-binding domain-containing protein [Planosporangium thailandense]NJC73019.1 hypothetical protein [Planosporangium thailandense]